MADQSAATTTEGASTTSIEGAVVATNADAGGASSQGTASTPGASDDAKKEEGAGAEKSLLDGANDEVKPADGDKQADEAKAAEVAAEPKYAAELKKPDGIPWNEATWKAVAPVLSQHQITQEAAQGLIDAFAAHQSAQQAEQTKVLMDARKAAREECQKEFQAPDFKAARRAIDLHCSDEHLKGFFLRELGDHPAFIRMMAAFGRAISDDSTPGAANSGGGSTPVNLADKFYGGK
jgi:hypothetical protein